MFSTLQQAHIKGAYTDHTDPAYTPFAAHWDRLKIRIARQMVTGEWLIITKCCKATWYGAFTYSYREGQLYLHYGIMPALEDYINPGRGLLVDPLNPPVHKG